MLWDDSLLTGIAMIDTQHKELIRRIDVLLEAGKQQRGTAQIKETLEFLQEYILIHFRAEQALHIQSKYPKTNYHKTLHDTYVKEVETLKKRYEKEGDTVSLYMSINKSVIDWLIQHIKTEDKDFSLFYNNQQK